ncbi:hypothetical protein DR864_09790 [Runella rosea]|uniref:Outer membrane protein beta-barrel domain-containing protein n=1 Tax=Runella rosea TaxID=2259595 RepID=A0A344TH83_9BACT|nr:hypothetical protein [Runella rosea]AXE18004.1 hypothetical protein DR864_09790 [Runella rosea]
MKSILYLCFVGLLVSIKPQGGFAQQTIFSPSQNKSTAKTWQIGLKEGYSRGNILKRRNGLQFHTGYSIANNLIIGLGAAWSKEWMGFGPHYYFNEITFGPFARYQFLSTRISPFIEASYQVGKRLGGENKPIGIAFVNPGLTIHLFRRLRADVGYSFQFGAKKYLVGILSIKGQNVGQAQIGLNYLFSPR